MNNTAGKYYTAAAVAARVSQSEPSTPAATDDPDTAYCADADDLKAVSWAVSERIVQGMGDGTFTPDKTRTQGKIMTFLCRAMGE
ncbi:MAG: S-layer homology domain-containing protein [Oscillospiraceae bacterium]|nr:S-layer homology domain-containing protein [Oscillospiraceae bacterium]